MRKPVHAASSMRFGFFFMVKKPMQQILNSLYWAKQKVYYSVNVPTFKQQGNPTVACHCALIAGCMVVIFARP